MTQKSRATINREKKEAKNRLNTRIFGVTTTVIGIVLELYYLTEEIKETIWGTIYGMQVRTSSLLIILGFIIVICSFKTIVSLLKKIKFFNNKK